MGVGLVILALIIATILTLIFAAWFERTGPWSSWLIFFLLVFLVAWAAGLWIGRRGPMLLGVYWLPVLATAILFAIFLAAATPSSAPREKFPPQGPDPDSPAERVRQRNIDVFLWILFASFLVVIGLGYAILSRSEV